MSEITDFSAIGSSIRKISQKSMGQAKKEENVLADKTQKRQHDNEIHGLRKNHAWLLFWLTVFWVVVVWFVLLLQGFGQWFIPIPSNFKYISFELSDAALIAFMTTTTTTVLGLYGIAAYWLYGNGNGKKRHPKK